MTRRRDGGQAPAEEAAGDKTKKKEEGRAGERSARVSMPAGGAPRLLRGSPGAMAAR